MSGHGAALDAQSDLVWAYASRAGRDYLAGRVNCEGWGELADRRDVLTLYDNSDESIRATVEGLPTAESVYIDEDICTLIAEGMRSWRDEYLFLREDLFTRDGFAYFARPVHSGQRGEESYALRAIQWRVLDKGAVPAEPAQVLLVAFYAEVDGSVALAGSKLLLDFVWPCFLGCTTPGQPPEVTAFAVMLRLANQRLAAVERQPAERATRRRAMRRLGCASDVSILRLRRREQAHSGNGGDVEWAARWLVRGHWRWQWFPSLQKHRQVWVMPYAKGPEDKPFSPKRRAWEFVR